MTVRRIAHLSDLHLLAYAGEGDKPLAGARTRFVSLRRALDVAARVDRALRALQAARVAAADHVVVSGDLTEVGRPEEFAVLADVLAASGWAPGAVTLVPGNHDRYADPGAWARALEGPLAAYAPTSASLPGLGHVVDLGTVRLLPIDVTRPQPVTRSAGFVTREMLAWMSARVSDPGLGRTPVVVAQHHPPVFRGRVWGWIDGLVGWEAQASLLGATDHVHVLHGHVHVEADSPLGGRSNAVFGAPAVVEDGDTARVRVYDVTSGGLVPARAD